MNGNSTYQLDKTYYREHTATEEILTQFYISTKKSFPSDLVSQLRCVAAGLDEKTESMENGVAKKWHRAQNKITDMYLKRLEGASATTDMYIRAAAHINSLKNVSLLN